MVMRMSPEQFLTRKETPKNVETVEKKVIYLTYEVPDIQRWIFIGAVLVLVGVIVGSVIVYFSKR